MERVRLSSTFPPHSLCAVSRFSDANIKETFPLSLCVCVYTLMNVFLSARVFLCTCTGGAVYVCCPRHFLSETQHFGLQISTSPFPSFGLTANKHWWPSSQKHRLTVTAWMLWQMASFSFGLCERNLFQFIERFCHHEYEPKTRVVKSGIYMVV